MKAETATLLDLHEALFAMGMDDAARIVLQGADTIARLQEEIRRLTLMYEPPQPPDPPQFGGMPTTQNKPGELLLQEVDRLTARAAELVYERDNLMFRIQKLEKEIAPSAITTWIFVEAS